MPILLTVPYNPGDNDPGNTYSHAQIFQTLHNAVQEFVRIDVRYGTYTDGYDGYDGYFSVFKEGAASPNKSFFISGPDYSNMLSSLPLSGDEPVYVGAKRMMYMWLVERGFLSGTVV